MSYPVRAGDIRRGVTARRQLPRLYRVDAVEGDKAFCRFGRKKQRMPTGYVKIVDLARMELVGRMTPR